MTSLPASAKSSTLRRLILSLCILVTAVVIFVYRQQLIDHFAVWQFTPTPEVVAIADRAQLNSTGRHYFYASRPELQERDVFNQSCTTRRSEATAVLGCYVSQRIYLFDVSDERLAGIEEVTAAHEMLHAAYDRLSPEEKTRVNGLLEARAAQITDQAFLDLMKEYEKTEPGERLNELHSLIGTQVADVGSELEAYYGRYFMDRGRVARMYHDYESVFTAVKQQQEQLARDLDAVVDQINRATIEYNQGVTELNQDIQVFNQQAQSGRFSSQSEFNAERTVLITRQQQLQGDRTLIDGYIATYNTLRQQLIAVNGQAEALNRSINSNLTPLPSI